MPNMRKDGYTEVGSRCAPFESRVNLEEVNGLRDFLVNDYFLAVPNLHVTSDENESGIAKIAHAKLFANKFAIDIDDQPSVFGSAMLRYLDADTWRMVIMQTRSRRRSENIGQQRIVSRYNVEVMGDDIVEAVKKVQIVRDIGELTLEKIERQMEEEYDGLAVEVERKAFERYMTPDDCAKAAEFLGRVTRRLVSVG